MRLVRRGHPERILPFELTPRIDVVFLLIIFFMVTAQFARLTRAEVDLPREKGEQLRSREEAGIVINITRSGEIIVQEQAITLDELMDMIRNEVAAAPGRSANHVKVLLRADRDADSAALNNVVSRLHETGLPAARLATEVPR